ncbi:Ion transport domain [Trypanosoma melophagium]|uniref:Ion transport domain n=1 Tax=Trypanosoma melophagium TaxID=715481 RepID=UPI00351A966D|nr:Ion transport domain [Trypanosoma melophagium]
MQFTSYLTSLSTSLKKWIPQQLRVYPERGSSLFIFAHGNFFRRLCYKIITHPYMFIIWVSATLIYTALIAAFQPNYNIGYATNTVLNVLQIVLMVFFWLRCIIEVIALGLILHPNSFLRSFWNALDVVLNIIGIIELLPLSKNHRWIHAFAVARPLRFLFRIPGVVSVILPVLHEMWLLGEVMIFFFVLVASFALIGVIVVGGELNKRCYITAADPDGVYASLQLPFLLRNVTNVCGVDFHCPSIVGATVECREGDISYASNFLTYNNIGSAMLVMIKISTMDNWYNDMESIMNAHGGATVILLVCMVIVSFFFFCLLLSVLHESYIQSKKHLQELNPPSETNQELLPLSEAWKRDAAVQVPDDESLSILFPREVRNVLDPNNTLSLGNSFDIMSDVSRKNQVCCFVPYPGNAPIPSFMQAYRMYGILNALRDQERTLYGPIFKGNFAHFLVSLTDSTIFCLFMIIMSLINTILLVVIWEGMNSTIEKKLMIAGSTCSLFFIIPVIMKCLSFGALKTFSDIWNIFDTIAAISGILELSVPKIFDIRIIRGLRTFRVLRLGKFVPFLRLFDRYFVADFAYLILLIAATLILFAILGMQLFGDSFKIEGWLRGSFGTFWESIWICFIVFTGDNWTTYMHAAIATGTPVTGIIYFITLYGISLVEYSLFLTLMIYRCECVLSALEREEGIEFPPLLVLPPYSFTPSANTTSMRLSILDNPQYEFLDKVSKQKFGLASRFEKYFSWLISSRSLRVKGDLFYVFKPEYSFHKLFLYILGSVWYRLIVLFLVLAGIVLLFFDNSKNTDRMNSVLWSFHLGYTIFFFLEMVLKCFVFGVFSPSAERDHTVVNPHIVAYFRDPINWVDFIANIFSFVGIYYLPCRAVKTIQIIRLLTSPEYPNVVFINSVKQIKYIWSALFLIVYVFIICGICGMEFFSGTLHYCTDRNIIERSACNETFLVTLPGYTVDELIVSERRWVTAEFSYNNFGSALISMFVIGLGNNWTSLMYAGMDSVSTTKALSRNHSGYYVIYFVLSVIILRFVALKTIIAVIAAYVSRLRNKYNGQTGFLNYQNQYMKAKFIIKVVSIKVESPSRDNIIRWTAHRILTAQSSKLTYPYFHYIVQSVIFINCAFLTTTISNEPYWRKIMIFSIDICGIIICGLEVLLRLVAYKRSQFFNLRWNIIDLIVLILIILAAAIPTLSFMRVFRVIKFFKCYSIDRILYSIYRNGFCLFCALVFCCTFLLLYTFVGVPLFGRIKLYSDGITEDRNFQTPIKSLLLMFQVVTLTGWEKVMRACAQNPLLTGCIPGSSTEGCGSTISSEIFFVTYMVLTGILLEWFMALFLEVFTTQLEDETTYAFLQFRRMWLETVGSSQNRISFNHFLDITTRIPYALTGIPKNSKQNHVAMIRFLTALQLPLDSKYNIRYNDILCGLVYKNFRILMRREFTSYICPVQRDIFTASQMYAAIIIQRHWRQGRCVRDASRHAMLDPVDAEMMNRETTTELSHVDSLERSQRQRRKYGESATVHPLRLQLTGQLPRGALAAPGTSLFMFDFIDPMRLRMPTTTTSASASASRARFDID